jgi:hypothetical protein
MFSDNWQDIPDIPDMLRITCEFNGDFIKNIMTNDCYFAILCDRSVIKIGITFMIMERLSENESIWGDWLVNQSVHPENVVKLK